MNKAEIRRPKAKRKMKSHIPDKRTNARALCIWAMALVILPALRPTRAEAQGREIARKAFPSVVLLVMEDRDGQPISLGSGFFVKDGTVATNVHVIEGAVSGYAKLVGQKGKFPIAGSVALDPKRDLALLAVPGVRAPALSIVSSGEASVGDEVYAVGNPEGLEGTPSQGIVSGLRKVGGDTLLQITAPISPGSSGGPVLNSEGDVIGIAVASFKEGQNLNFAVPASYVQALLLTTGSVKPLAVPKPTAQQRKASLSVGKPNEGVVGVDFLWTFVSGDFFSFSLRNKLDREITDVKWLVVFYDRQGLPIDTMDGSLNYFGNGIGPGLAVRVEGKAGDGVQRLTSKYDVRILDFKATSTEAVVGTPNKEQSVAVASRKLTGEWKSTDEPNAPRFRIIDSGYQIQVISLTSTKYVYSAEWRGDLVIGTIVDLTNNETDRFVLRQIIDQDHLQRALFPFDEQESPAMTIFKARDALKTPYDEWIRIK